MDAHIEDVQVLKEVVSHDGHQDAQGPCDYCLAVGVVGLPGAAEGDDARRDGGYENHHVESRSYQAGLGEGVEVVVVGVPGRYGPALDAEFAEEDVVVAYA